MMDKTVVTAFLEYSPNPTWLADSDGRCVYANQALRKISALNMDQLGHFNWLEFVADEGKKASSLLWQEARLQHHPYRARFFLTGRDPTSGCTVDVVGAGHIGPDGSEMWLFTAVPLIPPFKALPPIEANLQATLNALPIQTWYAQASGALAFVNTATASYLGLPPDHLLRSAGDLEPSWDAYCVFLHPEDRTQSSMNRAEYVRTGKVWEDRFRLLGADGYYRWFLSRAEPIRCAEGHIVYWVGVNIDIDDEKRASEALEAARERIARATQSAAIAEISASLSHKIVQPVAAVVANARAALNWLSPANLNISQAHAALEGVMRDGMSVGNVVHDMRQLLDHRRPNPRAIDLNILIEQMITLQTPDIRDKRIVIKSELNRSLPLAFADATQIQQVVFNLLLDTCEAISRSERAKELTVRTGFFDENVYLEVEDSGGCIADLEQLLEEVFTDESHGAVVALAVSRSILEAQGGSIKATRLKRETICIRIELPKFSSHPISI